MTLADLKDEPFPRWPGDTVSTGPLVRDGGQLAQLIALGRAVALLPASIEDHLRGGLVTVPVTDGPTSTLAIAWAEDSRSRPIAAFVQAARDSRDGVARTPGHPVSRSSGR